MSLNRIFGLKSKFTLLVLFVLIMVLGLGEYEIIAERLVKVICTSCIGLG